MNWRRKPLPIINLVLFFSYFAFSLIMVVYNALSSSAYYVFLSALSIFMIFIPLLFYKISRIKPSPYLSFIGYLFIILAFGVGMVFNGYSRIPYFDKVMHTASGVLFGTIGLLIYPLLLEKPKEICKASAPGFIYCCISFSALTAVIWEIIEYILNIFLHNDPQKVLTTGVNDTMLDMIFCLIGASAVAASVFIYFKTNRCGFLIKLVRSIYQDKNQT